MTDTPNDQAGQPADGARPNPTTVTVRDAFGRAQQLPREQWRKDVLPKMVEGLAQRPDQLAAMILQGVRDGLADDLLPAALRLAAVDQNVERGLSMLATVQRESVV